MPGMSIVIDCSHSPASRRAWAWVEEAPSAAIARAGARRRIVCMISPAWDSSRGDGRRGGYALPAPRHSAGQHLFELAEMADRARPLACIEPTDEVRRADRERRGKRDGAR